MPSQKRSFQAIDAVPEVGNDLLHRIRNMWEFANVCQWIYIFGKAAKIDESLDVEVDKPARFLVSSNSFMKVY